VTRFHHRWGASEAEIFGFKFVISQSYGRERNHSTTATHQNVKKTFC